jgi:two-component system sensor histidine kinase VicK
MIPYLNLRRLFISYKLWLLLAAVFILFSCKKKDTADTDNYYSGQFKVIFNNVNNFYDQNKPDKGLHYLDSAFKQIKNPNTSELFRFYGLKYLYHRKVSHSAKKALVYADSMLMMAKRNINSKLYVANYAEANFAMGDAYSDLSQFNNAYQCYYQGYFMGKNYLKNDILAEYTYRMGMVMFKQSHYKMAARYFKESYRQSLSYKDDFAAFYQRQELLNDIGESYKSIGEIDSASAYFSKALAYINANSERFNRRADLVEVARAVVYGDMGEIAMIKGNYQLANQLLQKSIEINIKKGNDNYNAELTEVNLGKLYLNNNKYGQFIIISNNLRNQLDSVKNDEAETNWNWLMSKYYTKKNDLPKAIKYLENYISLKDSVTKRSTSLKETDVNEQQANYDKQYQIKNLKDNNKLQLIYIYLAVTCAALALIIVFLIYRNWRKSKSDVQIVSALNKQITLQKSDLEITLTELEISGQEKDRILRTVAHDLRNPIGGIASLTLAMADDDYTGSQKELINLIKETSNNSLELINEILEVTNGKSTQLKTELVEINSLLSKSVELLRFKAAEKGQQIKLELLDEPEELLISREKIWRVIGNLISNAIKFSLAGGIICVKIVAIDNDVEISVRDTGIGIPENVKDKVFNIFTEAKRSGTAGEKSFGLGLSISKQIIENHGGKIWFENNNNTGTTFYIRLSRQIPGKTNFSKKQHTNVRMT